MLFVVLGAVGIAIATTHRRLAPGRRCLPPRSSERDDFALDPTFSRRFPAILAASAIMGVVVWALAYGSRARGSTPANGVLVQVASLCLLVGAGPCCLRRRRGSLRRLDANSCELLKDR